MPFCLRSTRAPKYCDNCGREHVKLSLKKLHKDSFPKMKYSHLTWEAAEEIVNQKEAIFHLCDCCWSYFDGNTPTMKVVWPSLFWFYLTNAGMGRRYGMRLWCLVPKEWRFWWINRLCERLPSTFGSISEEQPKPCIKDVTSRKEKLEAIIERKVLKEYVSELDDLHLPVVRCPWGCTEYYHRCGRLPLDVIFARCLETGKSDFLLLGGANFCTGKVHSKVAGVREDFLETPMSKTTCLLLNPDWEIVPSIAFLEGEPVILTCRRHDGGSNKHYVHPPYHPFSSFPNPGGEQLAAAKIIPRLLRSAKRRKFSNTYQTVNMQGHFDGVDTAMVSMDRNFGDNAPLAVPMESLSVEGRKDVKAFINDLFQGDEGLPPELRTSILDEAGRIVPDIKEHDWCLTGATYITMKQALDVQTEIKKTIKTLVVEYISNSGEIHQLDFTPTWPNILLRVHPWNSHGCRFPSIGTIIRSTYLIPCEDAKFLWSLVASHCYCTELWTNTCKAVLSVESWEGWLLHFMVTHVYRERARRKGRGFPFDENNKTMEETVLQKLRINETTGFQRLHDLFVNHASVLTMRLSQVTTETASHCIDLNTIIIVEVDIGGTRSSVEKLLKALPGYDARIVVADATDPLLVGIDWACEAYMRHGKPVFTDWWCSSSKLNHTWKVSQEGMKTNVRNKTIRWVVYVKELTENVEQMRNQCLDNIGGQRLFFCNKHKIPFVHATRKCDKCCNSQRGDTGSSCPRKVYLTCPVPDCPHSLCKAHVNLLEEGYDNDQPCFIGTESVTSLQPGLEDYEGEQNDGGDDTTDIHDDSNSMVSDGDSVHESQDSVASELSNVEDAFLTFGDTNTADFFTRGQEEHEDEILGGRMKSEEEEEENNIAELSTVSRLWSPTQVFLKNTCRLANATLVFNKVGSLLVRSKHKLQASIQQKNWLGKLIATTPGRSVPLVYAEGTLFPSIFWKDDGYGSIIGAIPSACMAGDDTLRTFGLAGLSTMLSSRLTMYPIHCSTDFPYSCYVFDSNMNLQMRGHDTRIIIHRGFDADDDGIKVNRDALFDSESIDSRPVVQKLAAAVGDKQGTYFGTHSVNQTTHFGLRLVRRWIDGDEIMELALGEYKACCGDIDHEIIERHLRTAIHQAAASVMLRNWMEVSMLYMEYITTSKETPLGKVVRAWWRHEYQGLEGNLSHLHYLIWIADEPQPVTFQRICGSIKQFIGEEEEKKLQEEGLLDKGNDAVIEVMDLAQQLLTHRCSDRCQKRVTPTGTRCRVENVGLENPEPWGDTIKELPLPYTEECCLILYDLGLMVKTNHGYEVSENVDCLKVTKYFPPGHGWEGRVSSCNTRLFVANPSNQNLTFCQGYLMARYVAKYTAKIDENNKAHVSTDPAIPTVHVADVEFLYNTKISGSAINTTKNGEKRRDKKHPTGRAVTLFEMLSSSMGYAQVHTTIEFQKIPTRPMAERSGFDSRPRVSCMNESRPVDKQYKRLQDISAEGSIPLYGARNANSNLLLPTWRNMSRTEVDIVRDSMFSSVSLCKIAIWGARPPELRFVANPGLYWKWFYLSEKRTFGMGEGLTNLLKNTSVDVEKFGWVDGYGHEVFARPAALQSIIQLLIDCSDEDFYPDRNINSSETPRQDLTILFRELKNNWTKQKQGRTEQLEEYEQRKRQRAIFLGPIIHQHSVMRLDDLPVIWYDNVNGRNGPRLLVHIVLSMGTYENEYELFTKGSMTECFRYARLLDTSSDDTIRTSIDTILKRYITEQLIFAPGGGKSFSNLVVLAKQALCGEFLHQRGGITDLPGCLFTQIQAVTTTKIQEHIDCTQQRVIEVTRLILKGKGFKNIPKTQKLLAATKTNPLSWNGRFRKHESQPIESHKEQMLILHAIVDKFQQYAATGRPDLRNEIIHGGPGTGKTTLMQLLLLVATGMGLYGTITATLSERATELGGDHIYHMFCLQPQNNASTARMAELAMARLLRTPDEITLLKKLDILFIDEFGQVSAQLMSTLDIILRRVRKCSLYMGGIVVVCTYDYLQLAPVNNLPPLMTPFMLTSYRLNLLNYSVRASRSEVLRKIQSYTRLTPDQFKEGNNRFEFIDLIKKNCTFVKEWDDDKIPMGTLRVVSTRKAREVATNKMMQHMERQHVKDQNIRYRVAVDYQASYEGEYTLATAKTVSKLSLTVKEPEKLMFYPLAQLEVTFNKSGIHSQTQLAVVLDIPSQENLDQFNSIEVCLAPPGCKAVNPKLCSEDDFIHDGWVKRLIGVCPDRLQSLNGNVQAKRKQYGLRPRVATTIHGSMGQDLQYIVTKVTSASVDSIYRIWEREQVTVLLSRTHEPENIFFVGDPDETCEALADCLEIGSQYLGYMKHIVENLGGATVALNTTRTLAPLQYFPFHASGFQIPSGKDGFVYVLVSLGRSDPINRFVYIGQTNCLVERLNKHNKGQGSNATKPPHLRPWAPLAFITGFQTTGNSTSDNNNRRQIEDYWRKVRREDISRRNRCKGRMGPQSYQDVAALGKKVMKKFILQHPHIQLVKCFRKLKEKKQEQPMTLTLLDD